MSGRAVDRARVALLAGSHAVDDIYQGAVPALLPFFIAAGTTAIRWPPG